MQNIKKFEDFSLVNEELESGDTTMVTPSTTAKVGGSNYDGKGTVFMPAGRYTAGSPTEVKFSIENTGSNTLILSKLDIRDGQLETGAGKDVIFNSFTRKTTGKSEVGKAATVNVDLKDVIIIPGKMTCYFSLSVNFKSKFSYKPGGTPIFDLIMNANVLKGTTPWSKENGKILIEFGWNPEVSYF